MNSRRVATFVLMGALVGCSDANLDQLDATLVDIRRTPSNQVSLAIEPFPSAEYLNYQYSESRSPFLAPERLARSETIDTRNSALAPDTQRPLEPLEAFALPSLRLVGTLQMGGQRVALVATPDGSVVNVREGNHMGANYGRVTRITLDEVTLIERIFSEQEGWQESPAALSLE